MYQILFFIILTQSVTCIAQDRFSIWENINYSAFPVSCNKDSTVVIATNREFDPDAQGGRFFGNYVDPKHQLRYAVATSSNGTWTVFIQPSLDSALRFISTDKNIVAFVHGDGKNFPIALKNSNSINSFYKVNVISFDYPSLLPGINGAKNFYNSRKNLKSSLPEFSKFLDDIRKADSNTNFSKAGKTLFLHSLGNYILKRYVTEHGCDQGKNLLFNNIIINSAAVRQGGHRKWVEQLNMQKRIYIVSNKRDFTLKGAMIITFAKQLGGNVRKPLAQNALYINFTSVADRAHNFFLEPYLLQTDHYIRYFYEEVLNGKELNLNDEQKLVKRKDKLGYDVR